MAPCLLNSKTFGLQTLEHAMRVFRTWDSVVSLLPKGGETIWGNLDWSPEEGHLCDSFKKRQMQASLSDSKGNSSDGRAVIHMEELTKYGRIVSFGKEASEVPSSHLSTLVSKVFVDHIFLFT